MSEAVTTDTGRTAQDLRHIEKQQLQTFNGLLAQIGQPQVSFSTDGNANDRQLDAAVDNLEKILSNTSVASSLDDIYTHISTVANRLQDVDQRLDNGLYHRLSSSDAKRRNLNQAESSLNEASASANGAQALINKLK